MENNIRTELQKAFDNNSERELLAVLKKYPQLFYELYSRKYGPCPCFPEVDFGGKLRCDFCWLNDNSDGPEWVLVEIEKPLMQCFNKNQEPTAELNHAIEQVKSWERYFNENPLEKKRIFGAVKKFRFVVVAGSKEEWSKEYAIKWRWQNNNETKYEVRTSDVFWRSLDIIEKDENARECFEIEMRSPSQLEKFYKSRELDKHFYWYT